MHEQCQCHGLLSFSIRAISFCHSVDIVTHSNREHANMILALGEYAGDAFMAAIYYVDRYPNRRRFNRRVIQRVERILVKQVISRNALLTWRSYYREHKRRSFTKGIKKNSLQLIQGNLLLNIVFVKNIFILLSSFINLMY